MTNKQTIEKLNEALNQLIDAYETLQNKNNNLHDEIDNLKAKNSDLEYKISNFSSENEVQETKIDGMLSKIQGLLKPSDNEIKSDELEKEIEKEDSIFDIKLDEPNNEQEEDDNKESTTKIDLGRMESLLNGLNNR